MESLNSQVCWRPLLVERVRRAATRPRRSHQGVGIRLARRDVGTGTGHSMTNRIRLQAAIALLFTVIGGTQLSAQYFGRNKVQYEKFDWRILKSDHFDVYFYPAESAKVREAGRLEERWYSRFSDLF